jgi:hypothetical protein
MIPQPVPQKRQAALSHLQSDSAFAAAACTSTGTAIPTAPAAAAAAELFKKSRRFIPIVTSCNVKGCFLLYSRRVAKKLIYIMKLLYL